jgi:hypothetical protein
MRVNTAVEVQQDKEYCAMNSSKQQERRKYPRIYIQVPLNLAFSEAETHESLNATSINVSMNGVYCTVNQYIPVFEKVLVLFVIPQKAEKTYNLVSQCEGIVVRIEPEDEEPERTEYNIALYFYNLSQTERMMLRALLTPHSS